MKTEQLWLRLFINTHERPSVVTMRKKLGWEGYGIYVGILSTLRGSEDGSMPTDFETIGWLLRCPSGIVKSVIMDFGLFTITEDGTRFFDQGLTDEMKRFQGVLDEKREAGKRGAKKRWGAKAERISNGDAISTPDQTNENMASAIETMADANDSDSLNMYKKQTLKTSFCNNQSGEPIGSDGTPIGVGLQNNKFQDDFFNQLDDRWLALMQRWYAHRKRLSPKLRNIGIIKDQLEYLVELSCQDICCAEAIVDYCVKQGYSGLYLPNQGRGGKSVKPSKKKDVKYSNDVWGNSQENLPKVELKIDENGNPCPF